MLLFWAEAGPQDFVTGIGGWSAAAILVGLMSWLLFRHLPAKDKQIEKLISDCDEHAKAIAQEYMKQIQQQRTDFDITLRYVVEQQEKHVRTMAEAIRQEVRDRVKSDKSSSRGDSN